MASFKEGDVWGNLVYSLLLRRQGQGKSHTAASAVSSLTRVPHCGTEFLAYTLYPPSNLDLWFSASPWNFLHVLETWLHLSSWFLIPQQRLQTFPVHEPVNLYFSLDGQELVDDLLLPWISRGSHHSVVYDEEVFFPHHSKENDGVSAGFNARWKWLKTTFLMTVFSHAARKDILCLVSGLPMTAASSTGGGSCGCVM